MEPSHTWLELVEIALLAASSELRNEVANREQQLAACSHMDDWRVRNAENQLRVARETLARGEERDRIAATRPPGCTCLGAGGLGIEIVSYGGEPGTVEVLRTYCCCPEAEIAKARDVKTKDNWLRHEWTKRVLAVRAPVGIPGLLKEASFKRSQHTEKTAEAMARIEVWATEPGCRDEPWREREEEDEAQIAAWLAWKDERPRSLYIHGEPGVGKTYSAVAAAHRLIYNESVSSVRFVRIPQLLQRLRMSIKRPDESEYSILEDLHQAELLILDDICSSERMTDWALEQLDILVDYRYSEQLLTIYTSNADHDDLGERMGERIAQRIAASAEPILLAGPVMRTIPNWTRKARRRESEESAEAPIPIARGRKVANG